MKPNLHNTDLQHREAGKLLYGSAASKEAANTSCHLWSLTHTAQISDME